MRDALQEILKHEAIIVRSRHSALEDAIDRAHKSGELARVIPGVFASAELAATFKVRTAAIAAVEPNLTFVRHTAARLTWWPELEVDSVQVATTKRRPVKGFSFEARKVPSDLRKWIDGAFISTPEHSVLELTDSLGGAVIDEALRRGVVTAESLSNALGAMPARAGNISRAHLVRESRDEPWSELERDAHVRLRSARITGWRTNVEVVIKGEKFYIDVAFPGLRLAVELDGWQFHKGHESFVSDRRRDVLLTLAGWTVLHFTAESIDEMAGQVREALSMLACG